MEDDNHMVGTISLSELFVSSKVICNKSNCRVGEGLECATNCLVCCSCLFNGDTYRILSQSQVSESLKMACVNSLKKWEHFVAIKI